MTAYLVAIVLSCLQTADPLDSAIPDGEIAHLFLPPMPLAEGRCLEAAWSDDSSFLLVIAEKVQAPPDAFRRHLESGETADLKAEVGLFAYNTRSGGVRRLWHLEADPGAQASAQFFTGSDVALVYVGGRGQPGYILRVTLGTSKVEVLERPAGLAVFLADPRGKYVASYLGEQRSIQFVPPSGRAAARRAVESDYIGGFAADGSGVIAGFAESGYVLITPDGEKVVEGSREFYNPEHKGRIKFNQSTTKLPGRKSPVRVLGAHVQGGAGLVIAIDVDLPFDGRSDRGVVYTSGSAILLRPVVQISMAAYQEMLDRQTRAAAMSRANQVARALMMFEGDNDRLPTQEEFEDGALSPYLMDGDLSGFRYQPGPPGGSPAQTQLGYIEVPGGRVIAFQDGHTRFVPTG